MSRPAALFNLPTADCTELQAWLRKTTFDQLPPAQRARILVDLDAAVPPVKISERSGISAPVVFKWRGRYQERSFAGLSHLPRPGQARKLILKQVGEVLTLTTRNIPARAMHWNLQLMVQYAGITVHQVREIWQKVDLKPHRLQTFKISQDPHFAEKVVDGAGLSMNPPENTMVLSGDEKTQIQALDRTQLQLPLYPWQIERRIRHGTVNLYTAFDTLTGRVLQRITQRHHARGFLDFLSQIERRTPPELDPHVILNKFPTQDHRGEGLMDQTSAHHAALHAHRSLVAQMRSSTGSPASGNCAKPSASSLMPHTAHSAKPFRWMKSAESILAKVQRARVDAVTVY